MNILLINHYAGSPSLGMEYRPYYMAHEWQKAGHNPLIVAASNAHVRSKQFKLKKDFKKYNIEGINYLILKTPKYSGSGMMRVLNMAAFTQKLYKYSKKIANEFKPDIVIASSTYPLDIYPARKIAKLSRAKLIFEVHDLWPLSPIELGGYSKWHPFIMIMQHAENYAYSHTDIVVSILPGILGHMTEHGLNPKKFRYIPNGVVVDKWDPNKKIPAKINTIIKQSKARNRTLIGYAGSHGLANSLNSLIDAMKILKNKKIDLLLIGDGPEKERLIQQANKLRLKNIHFIPHISKTMIPSLLNKLDILYIGTKKQPLYRFGISPNKLIDYMMAGKPIIQAVKTYNDIVSEAKCGIPV